MPPSTLRMLNVRHFSQWTPWAYPAAAAAGPLGRSRGPRNYRGRHFVPAIESLEGRTLLAALAPSDFLQTEVVNNLSNAMAMAFSPDGKLFIAEQAGTMEVWEGNVRLQANFFRDTPIVTQTSNERGLLGVAFDPNYTTNRYVYVHYTTTTADNHNRVSRFQANAAGDLALAGSEQVLLDLDPHSSTQHLGGAIHFGLDGKLYIPTGDNGNQDNGTSTHNSQRLDKLDGKVLRINPDGSIPADNPFLAQTTGKYQSIWALGLRNPFTFAVQPGTGRIFVNDVGQNVWEEINEGAAGANYGWPATEGDFNQASFPNFTRPFYTYSHSSAVVSPACAITGGVFYDPANNQFGSDYAGDYFFADYCSGRLYQLDTTTKTVTPFVTLPGMVDSVVDLTIDADGNLYYLARNSQNDPDRRGIGQVFKVSAPAGVAPTITQQPTDQTVAIDQSATFTVIASGASLSYQWQRAASATPADFTDIAGATSASYTLASAQTPDSGSLFRVIISNVGGTITSDPATLTVTSNHAPSATIDTPAADLPWFAGQQITFSGTGTDMEDGSLSAGAFFWEVRFYHDDGALHYHPFQTFSSTTGGSFTLPTTGETSPNVWYRLLLTVTDAQGASTTVQRDIFPQTVTVTLATNPAGLALTLDGQPAPASFVGVVGVQRVLGAPLNQTLGGAGYAFDSWSDGGAATHTIFTPTTAATWTANYVPAAIVGVRAEFFDDTTTSETIPDVTGRTPDILRTDAQVNYPVTATGGYWSGLDMRFVETFVSRHSGYLRVDQPGTYTLYLNSNDGSRLVIDGQVVVDNDGRHAMQEVSATRTLTAGYHPFRVDFFQALNSAGLILSWAGPAITKQVIPAANFVQGLPVGQPPTVATPASASPNPVTGTNTVLSALGADDGGEASLVYTWAATGSPPAPVTFSTNGTNAAKSTTATFTLAGSYNFTVTIQDTGGQSTTSNVTVTVNQTLTAIPVSPGSATLAPGASQQFAATARDQFGIALSAPITWSLDSGSVGSISAGGLYFAPASGTGSAVVRATTGSTSGTATVTVQTGPPAFQQESGADGLVVMEAENNDGNLSQGGKSWTTYTAISGFSGASALQATPNTGTLNNTGYLTTSPRLNFRINFNRTGVHYVWIRGLGLTGNDDTVHVGLDGAAVASADRISGLITSYGWTRSTLDGVVATINVTTTGIHTLNLWMREDGTIVDKILLTSNAAYTPTGAGPAQSPRTSPTSQPPTVATPAGASPNPVTGTNAVLSALGADDGGEASLIYTWATTGSPPAPVTSSTNGTNAAKSTTATFTLAGSYNFTVTIQDAGGQSTTSSVTVNQTLTAITVSPGSATLAPGASQQFAATARDQFGIALSAPITWSLDGGSVGSISTAGLYSAPASGTGSAVVRATSGSTSGTATVTVQTGPPAFQQDSGADGLVVMEAENNDGNLSQGGKNWTTYTAISGFSGASALQATPNTGTLNNTGYLTTSPRLDFRINFNRTGVHYVWIRGLGLTGNDDTVHVGLDGAAVTSADRISGLITSYGWTRSTLDGVVATINVTTTGIHTLNLWMREDGTIVDKILLTSSAAYTPTGLGPVQSPRSGA